MSIEGVSKFKLAIYSVIRAAGLKI